MVSVDAASTAITITTSAGVSTTSVGSPSSKQEHDYQTNLDAAQMIRQIQELTSDIHRTVTISPPTARS